MICFTLLCSEKTPRERLGRDIAAGLREPCAAKRSAARLLICEGMPATHIQTDGLFPAEVALLICKNVPR